MHTHNVQRRYVRRALAAVARVLWWYGRLSEALSNVPLQHMRIFRVHKSPRLVDAAEDSRASVLVLSPELPSVKSKLDHLRAHGHAHGHGHSHVRLR